VFSSFFAALSASFMTARDAIGKSMTDVVYNDALDNAPIAAPSVRDHVGGLQLDS
jgi:hypothetical protein